MEIVKTATINKPISEVWKILAIDFDKAGEWMTGVKHSYETKGNSCEGSPMHGRICEFSTKEKGFIADEKITLFDERNHKLGFQVIPKNISIPLVKNNAIVSLSKAGNNKTNVLFENSIELTTKGKFLYPLLKIGLGKNFTQILLDLKHFSETGKPHPKKQAELNKQKT